MFVPANTLRLDLCNDPHRQCDCTCGLKPTTSRSALNVPNASPQTSSPQDGKVRDPKREGPSPEYPQSPIESPGSIDEMNPRADHGEQSYVGLGRLKDRVALITGGDS